MSKKTKIGIAVCIYIAGVISGIKLVDWIDSLEPIQEYEIEVDSTATSATLMVVGMNALNDGIYDDYEIQQMLTRANI